MALTAAGLVLLQESRGVLAATEAAIRSTREAGRAGRGALRIGSIGVLSAPFLPGSLARFRDQHTAVDIEVCELGLDEQVAALLDGSIQLGFQVRAPGTPTDPRFAERAILTSRLTVALTVRHPLAGKGSLPLRALAKEKLLQIEPRPGSGYDRWVRALCEEVGGFTPKFRQPAVGNVEALFGMVAAGQGLAVLPGTVAARRLDASVGWLSLPLVRPALHLQVAAVWNPARGSKALNDYLPFLLEAPSPVRRERTLF